MSKQSSTKKIAANRRNAQKSTGPRNPRATRMRAEQRQSRYVKSLSYDQAKLGQNPEDFQEFLAELVADWQPAGAMEMTLVEDLATLEMERRLVDRAQRGRLVERLEREEAEVSRTARRLDEEATPSATREEVVALGLRNAPDSSGKFSQLMALMEGLLAVVKIGNFSCPAEEIFITLYGDHPSWRAAQIISSYKHFVARYEEAPEGFPMLIQEDPSENENVAGPEDQTPLDADEWKLIDPLGPRPWGEPARFSAGVPSAAENEYHSLHRLMLEEYDAVINDFRDFIRDRADLSRARRDALLAPNGNRSALMIRQKNSIDRHIERKIKLLLLLQKERRAREAAPHPRPQRKFRSTATRKRGRYSASRPAVVETRAAPSVQNEKCQAVRKREGAPRPTRRMITTPPSAHFASAFLHSIVRFSRHLGRRAGTSGLSTAASAFFFLLGVMVARLPLSTSASFAAPMLPATFTVAPESAGGSRRGAPSGRPSLLAIERTVPLSLKTCPPARELAARGPFHGGTFPWRQVRGEQKAGASPSPTKRRTRQHICAPKPHIIRDVFSHFESHQQYENNEMSSRRKANFWLFVANSLSPAIQRKSDLKWANGKEGDHQFSLYPLTFSLLSLHCDASETVTRAA